MSLPRITSRAEHPSLPTRLPDPFRSDGLVHEVLYPGGNHRLETSIGGSRKEVSRIAFHSGIANDYVSLTHTDGSYACLILAHSEEYDWMLRAMGPEALYV